LTRCTTLNDIYKARKRAGRCNGSYFTEVVGIRGALYRERKYTWGNDCKAGGIYDRIQNPKRDILNDTMHIRVIKNIMNELKVTSAPQPLMSTVSTICNQIMAQQMT
jgi:hypothetical protein